MVDKGCEPTLKSGSGIDVKCSFRVKKKMEKNFFCSANFCICVAEVQEQFEVNWVDFLQTVSACDNIIRVAQSLICI